MSRLFGLLTLDCFLLLKATLKQSFILTMEEGKTNMGLSESVSRPLHQLARMLNPLLGQGPKIFSGREVSIVVAGRRVVDADRRVVAVDSLLVGVPESGNDAFLVLDEP